MTKIRINEYFYKDSLDSSIKTLIPEFALKIENIALEPLAEINPDDISENSEVNLCLKKIKESYKFLLFKAILQNKGKISLFLGRLIDAISNFETIHSFILGNALIELFEDITLDETILSDEIKGKIENLIEEKIGLGIEINGIEFISRFIKTWRFLYRNPEVLLYKYSGKNKEPLATYLFKKYRNTIPENYNRIEYTNSKLYLKA